MLMLIKPIAFIKAMIEGHTDEQINVSHLATLCATML